MSEHIAYHEAGHALWAWLLGGTVMHVTLEPDNDDGPNRSGDTQVAWPRAKLSERQFAQMTIQVCLAGPVAEMIYSGEPYHPGGVAEWAADWQEAWEAAAVIHPTEQPRLRYLEQLCIQLHRALQDESHWAALASLADHLLAHETLDSEMVAEIVQEWLP